MPMRRVRLPAVRSGVVLNSILGIVAVLGAALAYYLVTDTAAQATATTGTSRSVPVTEGAVTATVSASGSVQSASTAAADFVTGGTVTSIAVHVGDAVTKGQELARVDPVSAQATVDTAAANLAAARASLTRAQAGGDDATIASAQAQVTTTHASLAAAQRALDGTILTAPMAGTVTAITGSIGGAANPASGSTTGGSASGGSAGGGSTGGGSTSGSASGGSSSTGSGFIQLADLTQMQVAANFAEADATKLKAGQAAIVTWAALTGATAEATVATIAPTATTSNNVNSYAVLVSLGSLPAGVRIGQTVTVVVTTGQADNAVRVPTAAVRTTGNRHLVTVVANGQNETREVAVGVEGDTFEQITSGVTVGEQVLIVTATTTTGTTGGGGFGGGFGGGGLGGGAGGGPGTGQRGTNR